MIIPISFAIHITYRCPLRCAHCCFNCSPTNPNRLPLKLIIDTIGHLDSSTIKLLALTGGEPFLLGQELVEIVREANKRALKTRIVTSAFFGKKLSSVKKKLNKLYQVGLNELSISWDDYHEEFIPFSHIYNVFWSAKELGLTVAINIVQSKNPRWSASRVGEELGLNNPLEEIIVESPINLNGRAEANIERSNLRSLRTLGPCPYVLTGPTLSAKKKLLACCGVIPETEQLVLDSDFLPENLSATLQKASSSPLLAYLYLRGPFALMELIASEYGVPIIKKEQISGNCEACRLLLNNIALSSKIPHVLQLKSDAIAGELFLLKSLGLLKPRTIMEIWKESSTIVDTAFVDPSKEIRG